MSKKKTSRRNVRTTKPRYPGKPQQSNASSEGKPVERYFTLVVQKRLSEAEKELVDIKSGTESSEWSRGYMKALEGLLAVKRSNNERYSNLSSLDSDPKLAQRMKRVIRGQLQNQLHAEYDRGYFSGLMEYVKTVQQLQPWERMAEKES
jgi:hypothetical protein